MFAPSLSSSSTLMKSNLMGKRLVKPTCTRPIRSSNPAPELQLIDQPHSGAHDKCFDISNTKSPSSTCPFPIIFISISQTLANLLATHPQLPLRSSWTFQIFPADDPPLPDRHQLLWQRQIQSSRLREQRFQQRLQQG